MSTVSNSRSEFWTSYFGNLAEAEQTNTKQLDFSNHALVVQNYAYVLEAIGSLADKRVLDAGFGTGELSRILDLLGAKVSAVDVVPTRIPSLREQAPSIAWWQGDLGDWTLPRNADPFDVVVAAESLQYVDFNDAVNRLLSAVATGGRLIVLIPNADCPIIERTSERFDQQFTGVSLEQLPDRLIKILEGRSENDTRTWRVDFRGIYFQADQTVVPYRSGAWQSYTPAKPAERTPGPHFTMQQPPANRVQIVFSDTAKIVD